MKIAKHYPGRVSENLSRIGALGMARSICESYGVPLEQVIETGKRRLFPETSRARRRIWMVIRHTRPDISCAEIARLFGGMDHTSILTGVRKAELEHRAELEALGAL